MTYDCPAGSAIVGVREQISAEGATIGVRGIARRAADRDRDGSGGSRGGSCRSGHGDASARAGAAIS